MYKMFTQGGRGDGVGGGGREECFDRFEAVYEVQTPLISAPPPFSLRRFDFDILPFDFLGLDNFL